MAFLSPAFVTLIKQASVFKPECLQLHSTLCLHAVLQQAGILFQTMRLCMQPVLQCLLVQVSMYSPEKCFPFIAPKEPIPVYLEVTSLYISLAPPLPYRQRDFQSLLHQRLPRYLTTPENLAAVL